MAASAHYSAEAAAPVAASVPPFMCSDRSMIGNSKLKYMTLKVVLSIDRLHFGTISLGWKNTEWALCYVFISIMFRFGFLVSG